MALSFWGWSFIHQHRGHQFQELKNYLGFLVIARIDKLCEIYKWP